MLNIHRHNRSRRKPLHHGELGQSLVEFALVLPIFLMVIMATIDFGWALRGWITATNSAREGARVGVTGANSAAITSKVVSTSSGLISAGNVSVGNAQGRTGENVVVSVRYNYQYITPLGGLISMITGGSLPNPLPVSSSTTMRLE